MPTSGQAVDLLHHINDSIIDINSLLWLQVGVFVGCCVMFTFVSCIKGGK